MSKELAEKLETRSEEESEQDREHFNSVLETNPMRDFSKEELEKHIEKARNGDPIAKRVNSWEEMWNDWF